MRRCPEACSNRHQNHSPVRCREIRISIYLEHALAIMLKLAQPAQFICFSKDRTCQDPFPSKGWRHGLKRKFPDLAPANELIGCRTEISSTPHLDWPRTLTYVGFETQVSTYNVQQSCKGREQESNACHGWNVNTRCRGGICSAETRAL